MAVNEELGATDHMDSTEILRACDTAADTKLTGVGSKTLREVTEFV